MEELTMRNKITPTTMKQILTAALLLLASAVVAREKQVATQMLNSTVGQVNEKISNSFISNGLQEIWKDWFK